MDWNEYTQELLDKWGNEIQRPDNYSMQIQEMRMDSWLRMKSAILNSTKNKYRMDYENDTALAIDLEEV